MSNTNISGLGNMAAQSPVSLMDTDRQTKTDDNSFLDVMSSMAAQAGNQFLSQNSVVESANDSNNKISVPTDDYRKYQYRKADVKEQDFESNRTDSSAVREKLDDYANDVKEVLKEELGVTEEEIESAMEKLGITFADLVNPNQLAGLAAELTGSQEIASLLCNSDFLSVMQEVGELSENLLNELGISQDEFMQMCENVLGLTQEEMIPETETEGIVTENMQEETAASVKTDLLSEKTDSLADQTAISGEEVSGDVKLMQEVQTEDEKNTSPKGDDSADDLTEDLLQQSDSEAEVVPVKEQASSKEETLSQNNHPQNSADGASVILQNPTETAGVHNPESSMGFSGQLDIQNIIKQIVEFTKVTVAEHATTMEMQLNPEHLGKIFLELTSKEGSVSAKIMAQNEVVKEALEAQIADLRQNMNQSGIKVDAIEVTVESHEFERNLEQNARQDERQAEQQEKAAKQTRRINLNDLDELGNMMTEEEALVAQMMADQGNSVDFTA